MKTISIVIASIGSRVSRGVWNVKDSNGKTWCYMASYNGGLEPRENIQAFVLEWF